MTGTTQKPHKFFERFLDNDLDNLYGYLENKIDEILAGTLFNIDSERLSKFNKNNGPATQLGSEYNVFNFEHEGLDALQNALRDAIQEACKYYGVDFEASDYRIHGWYNYDQKTEGGSGVNPVKNEMFMHDHMGGEGAPYFHGYYCVNAEPSITYYKINGIDLFENHNKNNRAIISETGHPHGRDDWYEDKPRITIAYDISPFNLEEQTDKWIKL
jgi:hypothetical protein